MLRAGAPCQLGTAHPVRKPIVPITRDRKDERAGTHKRNGRASHPAEG